MATRLRFTVDVHLDLDDPELNDISVPRDERICNNVSNIAETIEQVIVEEYGVPYVVVSANFKNTKEDG